MGNVQEIPRHLAGSHEQRGRRECCPVFMQMLLGLAAWTLIYLELDRLARWATYELLGLTRDSHLGGAVEFFIADAPKVLLLLVLITFVVGITRTFLTPERIRELLVGHTGAVG